MAIFISAEISSPARFRSLDALRGIAAFAVVFWHWKNFWESGLKSAPEFSSESQPLFDVFFLFYKSGELAVDLFFSLSGFIFYWLYLKLIESQNVSAQQFFILRFSRLYPLHICTLFVVMVAQIFYREEYGENFAYPFNDTWHFLLNLSLLPSIGLEQGYSFNAPVWSVSVEIMLYSLFFIICWHAKTRLIYLVGLSLVGLFLIPEVYTPIGRGVASFFLGGCTFYLYKYLLHHNHQLNYTLALAVVSVALWLMAIYFSFTSLSVSNIPLIWRFPTIFPVVILFPITILSLALLEANRLIVMRRLTFLGDISYSTYLWHFPLQLFFMLAIPYFGETTKIFYSTGSLLLFFLLLITISLLSYHYLEMPAQRYIRRVWLAYPR